MKLNPNRPAEEAWSDLEARFLPLWKRAIDLVCCFLALPFLAVLTLVMTVITKLIAPGPVFFRQERIGLQGRRFKIYKFRSMYANADTSGHQNYVKQLIGTNAPMVKLDARGDARLIPGSWLLRASGLDELPQILNVLRGEMSIVGPRPCLPAEFAAFLPWQQQRCNAMPGLTGLWQVSGKNRTTFEQMIRFDITYTETKSLGLDLKIILLTVPALLVQIYDTRLGRKSAPPGAHTIPPFAMTAVSVRSSASPFPPRS
jgi:lipopolysaccharide/colanic/teichoic acid biosynthesis glycosyltransferase